MQINWKNLDEIRKTESYRDRQIKQTNFHRISRESYEKNCTVIKESESDVFTE